MRIRTIKPSFWRSDDITALPMDIRLLFVGLWSYVDDNGVGIDDYRQIAADLFALEEDQTTIRQFVRDGLATLSRRLLVVRYKIDDKCLIFVTKWDLHQKVDRPAKPRYPRPPDDFDPTTSVNGYDHDQVATLSRHPRDGLAPVVGEQGNRGTGEQTPLAAVSNLTPDRPREEDPACDCAPAIAPARPGPAVTGPTAADAYRIVDRAIGREHPHTVRTALAIEAQTLLHDGTESALVDAALTLWLEKPHLGPRSLPSLVSEVIRRRDKRPALSGTDANIAAMLTGTPLPLSETDRNITAMLGHPPDEPPALRALPGGAA